MWHKPHIVIDIKQSINYIKEYLKMGVKYLNAMGIQLNEEQKAQLKELQTAIKRLGFETSDHDILFRRIQGFLLLPEGKSDIVRVNQLSEINYKNSRDIKNLQKEIKTMMPASSLMKLFSKTENNSVVLLKQPVLVCMIGNKSLDMAALRDCYLRNKPEYKSPQDEHKKRPDAVEKIGDIKCPIDIYIMEKSDDRDVMINLKERAHAGSDEIAHRYKGEVALICFDSDDAYSLRSVENALSADHDYMKVKHIPCILVGCHFEDKRSYFPINEGHAEDYARKMHMPYIAINAVTGEGVLKLFKLATLVAAATGRPDLIPFHRKEAVLTGLDALLANEQLAIERAEKAAGRHYKAGAAKGALAGTRILGDVLALISTYLRPQDAAQLAATSKAAWTKAEEGAAKDNNEKHRKPL